MSDTVQATVPPLTQEDYDTLLEALAEYDEAFGGKTRVLPESANAREWLRKVFEAQNANSGNP